MAMDYDTTQLIGAGTAAYPLDPASAEQLEPCPHCNATIPPGEQFCPKCGYQRGTWAGAGESQPAAGGPSPWVLEDAAGRQYTLPLGETVIGRGEVDIQVPDGYMSRRHASLSADESGVLLTDLGSANGSFIGERRLNVDEGVRIEEDAELKLGQTTLRLKRVAVAATDATEAAAAAGAEAPTAAIVALEQPAQEQDMHEIVGETGSTEPAGLAPIGELSEMHAEIAPATSPWALARAGAEPEFFLPYGETILGRKPDKATMIVRGDGYVSGAHARLVATETTLEVADLESTNGTFVGGEQLAPGVVRQLGPGDLLRLGQTELTVVYNELGEARSAPEPQEPAP